MVFLICRPLAANWDTSIGNVTRGNEAGGYLSANAFNFAIDLAIALLPAPVLWNLQMPKYKKIGIIVIFALGSLYVFLVPLPPTCTRNHTHNRQTHPSLTLP